MSTVSTHFRFTTREAGFPRGTGSAWTPWTPRGRGGRVLVRLYPRLRTSSGTPNIASSSANLGRQGLGGVSNICRTGSGESRPAAPASPPAPNLAVTRLGGPKGKTSGGERSGGSPASHSSRQGVQRNETGVGTPAGANPQCPPKVKEDRLSQSWRCSAPARRGGGRTPRSARTHWRYRWCARSRRRVARGSRTPLDPDGTTRSRLLVRQPERSTCSRTQLSSPPVERLGPDVPSFEGNGRQGRFAALVPTGSRSSLRFSWAMAGGGHRTELANCSRHCSAPDLLTARVSRALGG
jgi:hypothetical protein